MLNAELGVPECSDWLSSKLPRPSFDIFQDDNVRKSNEAQNYFIACIVNIILDYS
jgi:hypothetical protein